MLLACFSQCKKDVHFCCIGRTPSGGTRRCGLAVLLNKVDVDDQDSTETHVVCEPERRNECVLLDQGFDDSQDVFGSLNTFLDMGADH